MNSKKQSFIAYCEWQETFEALSDEQAGKLIKHILRYANGEIANVRDPIINIAFIAMRQQLKRDLKKYEKKTQKSSVSGRIGNLKRWNKDLFLRVKNGEITLEEAESIGVNRKTSGGDNFIANLSGSDNFIGDNDNDNVNDIRKEKYKKERFKPPSVLEVCKYMVEKKIPEKLAKIESQKFWDFYESKNWYVGKNKMVKWKSSASGWLNRMKNKKSTSNHTTAISVNPDKYEN